MRLRLTAATALAGVKTTNDEIVRDMMVNGNLRDRASALGFMAGGRRLYCGPAGREKEQVLRQQELQGRQDLANADFGLRRRPPDSRAGAQARQEALCPLRGGKDP